MKRVVLYGSSRSFLVKKQAAQSWDRKSPSLNLTKKSPERMIQSYCKAAGQLEGQLTLSKRTGISCELKERY